MNSPRSLSADISTPHFFEQRPLGQYCSFPLFSEQETHRVKLLVGAIEVALEQETILAVLRIASSVLVDSPLPPRPPSPVVTPGRAVPTNSRSIPATPRADSCSGTATGVLVTGDGDTNGGGCGLAMPMLPCGVSVTLSVDFAAMSVVLTNARTNVIAVTFGAAHCKVNVSEFSCRGYLMSHLAHA